MLAISTHCPGVTAEARAAPSPPCLRKFVCLFCFETSSCYVDLAGLELVVSPSAAASQVLGSQECATTASCIDCFVCLFCSLLWFQTSRAGPHKHSTDFSGGEDIADISIFQEVKIQQTLVYLWIIHFLTGIIISLSFYPDNQVLEAWLSMSPRCRNPHFLPSSLVLWSGHHDPWFLVAKSRRGRRAFYYDRNVISSFLLSFIHSLHSSFPSFLSRYLGTGSHSVVLALNSL